MRHRKQRRLVLISPDGMTTVFSEDLRKLAQGSNLLPQLLQEGWKKIRQSQSHQGGPVMVLLEKELDD